MRAVFYQLLFAPMLALVLNAAVTGRVAAEEFKYYVWIDEEGIVHASQEAPKGLDYKVRIIEDINANVVPAEDFAPYGNVPYRDSEGAEPAAESSDTTDSAEQSEP